jgi:hypothetical protein
VVEHLTLNLNIEPLNPANGTERANMAWHSCLVPSPGPICRIQILDLKIMSEVIYNSAIGEQSALRCAA